MMLYMLIFDAGVSAKQSVNEQKIDSGVDGCEA